MNLLPASAVVDGNISGRSAWLFSWPLVVGVLAYLFTFFQGSDLLMDGDTYWHIASGHWIFQHGAVPTSDPFSHTMRGAQWTAHEWLSEVILATAHDMGAWTGVTAMTALAFAVTAALLTRALLKSLEPIYALLFAAFAVAMAADHLLARPHILAMPLMMIWTIGMVRASESGHAPRLWLLPIMTLWANLHGGFTLGLVFACPFALEAVLAARHEHRATSAAKSWAVFLVLALASALITPHGMQGILFTWQILFEGSYALKHIGEWKSPNFQKFQVMEIWLLAGLALVMYQGLRLPPIRFLLLLGLIHLALKHARNIELLGLLVPLLLATPFAAQRAQAPQTKQHLDAADRFFRNLAQAAGWRAITLTLVVLLSFTLWISRSHPPRPPESAAPILAIAAAQEAGIKGPVLNGYGWGGYLIYAGIPTFIDGRADMYKDNYFRAFLEALSLKTTNALEDLLHKYKIEWTLLPPDSPAVALLEHLPDWRRLYADKTAVVHVKTKIHQNISAEQDSSPSANSIATQEK